MRVLLNHFLHGFIYLKPTGLGQCPLDWILHITFKYLLEILYTLWLFNIAMENGPFIDGLPIKHVFFPWLC